MKLKNKILTGVALASTAGIASADIATDITSAFTTGQTHLTLAAGGVIAMVAVLTGVGLVVSMLRK
jgi:hypothetical protein